MQYVLPVPAPLRGRFLDYSRLYAFPKEPEKSTASAKRIRILDSGAFGLSQNGGEMSEEYFFELSEYYKRFDDTQTLYAAPDVYLDPDKSMENFLKWKKLSLFDGIAPVLQCNRNKYLSCKEVIEQILFYKKNGDIRNLFFSNPGLKSFQFHRDFFLKIRREFPEIRWLHVLGAGWDIDDIQHYATLPGIDSIDSIAYYNSADTPDGNWTGCEGDKWEVAYQNAILAQQITQFF